MKMDVRRREAEMSVTGPLRSYGRRKGKPLSARKERLIRALLPLLRVDLAKKSPCPLAAHLFSWKLSVT